MAGDNCDRNKLNKTLLFIVKLLNQNNISKWFIAYGTLLGIIRENSCIDGDDDIDIIIDINHRDQIKKILEENSLKIAIDDKHIIKTVEEDYASVDFYLSNVDEKGNFHDKWENVLWSNCYKNENKLIEYEWNGEILYLPNNFKYKLTGRYGDKWRIPEKSKGVTPRKTTL